MTIEKSLPNMVMVCVDGVENGDIYGRYFHRYKKEETFFPDSATLVIEMERFYDAIGYPQAATKTRKFMERKGGRIPAKEHMAVISDGQALIQLRGNLATFLVGVLPDKMQAGREMWSGWSRKSESIFAAIWNWSYLWMTR